MGCWPVIYGAKHLIPVARTRVESQLMVDGLASGDA